MKKIGLYYVYDRIGEAAITPVIPCSNDLNAAIGFRDSYIKPLKDGEKIPYNYKALDLVCIGQLKLDENGNMRMDPGLMNAVVIKGDEIINFISTKCAELGIDDDMLEENQEEEK